MLDHYWLKMIPNYGTKMSRPELREFKKVHKYSNISTSRDESNVDKLSDGRISDNIYP